MSRKKTGRRVSIIPRPLPYEYATEAMTAQNQYRLVLSHQPVDHVGHSRTVDALFRCPIHSRQHLIVVYIQGGRDRRYWQASQTQVDIDLVKVECDDGYLARAGVA